MEKTGPDIIIIRRRQARTADVPKGGVWKIAHADFMTALMALFLVLWLVNSTTRETRTTVAQYFNPIRLSDVTPDRKGVRDPQNAEPGELDDASRRDGKTAGTTSKEPDKHPTAVLKERSQATAPFEDPYALLAEASALKIQPGAEKASAVTLGSAGKPGMQGGEALRDPFDPNFWRDTPPAEPQKQASPAAKQPEADKSGAQTSTMTAMMALPTSPEQLPQAAAAASSGATQAKEAGEPADASARSSGAQPLTPRPGAAPQATLPPPVTPSSAQRQTDEAVAAAIAAAIGKGAEKRDTPQIDVRQTDEGMLISLTDNANFGMFAIGSAEPAAETVNVMQRVAAALGKRDGSIIIRGHTDARPFRSGNGDNWRLSTARAHTAQDLLIRGGINEARIEHVEGYASRKPRATDPGAAENRRIEILIREKRT